jgi:Rps23 Pro-64 3,4-dihydroxylase Tpa1-like proline 4-hydroxylase
MNQLKFSEHLFDYPALMALGRENASVYQSADPFPHIVFDDFLPSPVVEEVLKEFPGPEQVDWNVFDNKREKKLACNNEREMGPHIRDLIAQLSSMTFLEFLTALTGLEGLIQDPYLIGGGMHQIVRGGKLNVHADFNWHQKLKMHRRLNLLLYLNKDWDESYGGQLELWDKRMEKRVKSVLPIFNRCVIFSTNSDSFHGHPYPLACPDNRSRKSIALYYYTSPATAVNASEQHPTLFQAAPKDSRLEKISLGAKYFLRSLTPPVLVDLKRAIQKKFSR